VGTFNLSESGEYVTHVADFTINGPDTLRLGLSCRYTLSIRAIIGEVPFYVTVQGSLMSWYVTPNRIEAYGYFSLTAKLCPYGLHS